MGARTKDVTRRTAEHGHTGLMGARVVRKGRMKVGLRSSYSLGAYLFPAATVIILAFLVYMQILVVDPMRRDSRDLIKRLAFFYGLATQDTVVVSDLDVNEIFRTITNANFPVVITDSRGEPHLWKAIQIPEGNPRDLSPVDRERMRRIVRRLDSENPPYSFEIPQIGPRVLHFGDSPLVRRLAWLPWVALGVTALFIGVGYLGFQNVKNSEQRSIWVGMARETAHQLGTPLSSLYGWIELIKSELEHSSGPVDEETRRRFDQIVVAMEEDTSRLDTIVSRFSLIGSTPELRLENLRRVIEETASYLRDRLSREVRIVQSSYEIQPVPLNRQLLGWAFENLFKNAADAMEGKGGKIEISAEVRSEGKWVDVRVRDNGKGIQPNLVKQVFLPGYSTKERGWGLGLTFVKRIVEDYHRGRISVEESSPEMGTTFLISLPVRPEEELKAT